VGAFFLVRRSGRLRSRLKGLARLDRQGVGAEQVKALYPPGEGLWAVVLHPTFALFYNRQVRPLSTGSRGGERGAEQVKAPYPLGEGRCGLRSCTLLLVYFIPSRPRRPLSTGPGGEGRATLSGGGLSPLDRLPPVLGRLLFYHIILCGPLRPPEAGSQKPCLPGHP
jgi:hypothetical protein